MAQRRERVRRADHAGERRRLAHAELGHRLPEIDPGRLGETVDADHAVVSEVDRRQVALEDLALPEAPFQCERHGDLAQFAQERPLLAEEVVLHHLLRDRAAALAHAARGPVHAQRPQKRADVDAGMGEEACVLGRQHRIDRMGRCVADPERLAGTPVLVEDAVERARIELDGVRRSPVVAVDRSDPRSVEAKRDPGGRPTGPHSGARGGPEEDVDPSGVARPGTRDRRGAFDPTVAECGQLRLDPEGIDIGPDGHPQRRRVDAHAIATAARAEALDNQAIELEGGDPEPQQDEEPESATTPTTRRREVVGLIAHAHQSSGVRRAPPNPHPPRRTGALGRAPGARNAPGGGAGGGGVRRTATRPPDPVLSSAGRSPAARSGRDRGSSRVRGSRC